MELDTSNQIPRPVAEAFDLATDESHLVSGRCPVSSELPQHTYMYARSAHHCVCRSQWTSFVRPPV